MSLHENAKKEASETKPPKVDRLSGAEDCLDVPKDARKSVSNNTLFRTEEVVDILSGGGIIISKPRLSKYLLDFLRSISLAEIGVPSLSNLVSLTSC